MAGGSLQMSLPAGGLPAKSCCRAIGAVVAQQLYTLWVGGSNPSSPTIPLKPMSLDGTKLHFGSRAFNKPDCPRLNDLRTKLSPKPDLHSFTFKEWLPNRASACQSIIGRESQKSEGMQKGCTVNGLKRAFGASRQKLPTLFFDVIRLADFP
jgi:hypothetical protein